MMSANKHANRLGMSQNGPECTLFLFVLFCLAETNGSHPSFIHSSSMIVVEKLFHLDPVGYYG